MAEMLDAPVAGAREPLAPAAARTWTGELKALLTLGWPLIISQLAQNAPGWMAYDLRLMMSRIQQIGQLAADGAAQKLEQLLGRPLRTYADFVAERVKLA